MRRYSVVLLLMLLGLSSCLPKKPIVQPQNTTSTPSTSAKATQTTEPTTSQTVYQAGPVSVKPGTSLTGLQYIERFKAIAIEEMYKHGIPASIKLAQGMLESGSGTSRLAQQANNHFGIKCTGDWEGGRTYHDDDAENDCFRVYTLPEESYRDHSQFLLRKRYEKLFTLDKRDYKAWAIGLKEAGYATNPRYAELLIDLIERYDLHQFDTMSSSSLAQNTTVQTPLASVTSTTMNPPVAKPTETQSAVNQEKKEAPLKSPTKMVIHEVKEGETAAVIAAKYGLTVQELLTLNGLRSQDFSKGQLLVVSK